MRRYSPMISDNDGAYIKHEDHLAYLKRIVKSPYLTIKHSHYDINIADIQELAWAIDLGDSDVFPDLVNGRRHNKKIGLIKD